MSTQYKRCYHSHPPLHIDGFKIYGGSCISPVVEDADVYVGFDYGMKYREGNYPWKIEGKCDEVFFKIQDMGVPTSVEDFKGLLLYLESALRAGKKVHCGCIGGHGRTGMVFSALVSQMMPDEPSPTEYVRQNYCKKAVESSHQVQWLHQHFGIKKVKGAKEGGSGGLYGASMGTKGLKQPKGLGYGKGVSSQGHLFKQSPQHRPRPSLDTDVKIKPTPGPESIWYVPKGLTSTVTKLD